MRRIRCEHHPIPSGNCQAHSPKVPTATALCLELSCHQTDVGEMVQTEVLAYLPDPLTMLLQGINGVRASTKASVAGDKNGASHPQIRKSPLDFAYISNDIVELTRVQKPTLKQDKMTTIPSRLAQVARMSGSPEEARKRVIDLYRDWVRAVSRFWSFVRVSCVHTGMHAGT